MVTSGTGEAGRWRRRSRRGEPPQGGGKTSSRRETRTQTAATMDRRNGRAGTSSEEMQGLGEGHQLEKRLNWAEKGTN